MNIYIYAGILSPGLFRRASAHTVRLTQENTFHPNSDHQHITQHCVPAAHRLLPLRTLLTADPDAFINMAASPDANCQDSRALSRSRGEERESENRGKKTERKEENESIRGRRARKPER